MGETVIPLADLRYAAPVPAIPAQAIPATGLLADALGRPLHDLRISVTDRCNFRCSYCMPKEIFDRDYVFLPQTSLLSFEEITRLARIFVAHGVQKIRLTGGEPLLRKGLEGLIAMLADLRTPDGARLDITLTTNGSVLARKAVALQAAGLQRVTVSLDGLDDAVFRRMNDVDFPVADVLAGIAAAHAAGLGPIKVNMVVKRGTNDQEIVPMARYFREHFGGQRGAALHRVHGRRRQQRLAHGRGAALGRGAAALAGRLADAAAGRHRGGRDRRTLGLCRRRRRDRPDQQRDAGLLPATATAPACPPKASCSCACLPPAGMTCAACCAVVSATRHHQRAGGGVGRPGRPLFRTARRPARRARRRCAAGRDALHRRLTPPGGAAACKRLAARWPRQLAGAAGCLAALG